MGGGSQLWTDFEEEEHLENNYEFSYELSIVTQSIDRRRTCQIVPSLPLLHVYFCFMDEFVALCLFK